MPVTEPNSTAGEKRASERMPPPKRQRVEESSSSSEGQHSEYRTEEDEDDEDIFLSPQSSAGKTSTQTAKSTGKSPNQTPSRGNTTTANATSVSTPARAPPKKRVRKPSQTQPKPPSASATPGSGNNAGVVGPLAPGDPRHFASSIYKIYLGAGDQFFTAHESVLQRSTRFVDYIAKAKAKPRKAHQQILRLSDHNRTAFGQMLQYLYKDTLTVVAGNRDKNARKDELLELMSLSKYYNLPALQTLIVSQIGRSTLPRRLGKTDFFDWAEEMYCEELDHQVGPFTNYFQRVAPAMILQLNDTQKTHITSMVSGGFGQELFKAMLTALSLKSETPVKQEPQTTT